MYYRGATAAIVVYDVTNPASFEGAKSWVRELQRRGDPHVVIALAANKVGDNVARLKFSVNAQRLTAASFAVTIGRQRGQAQGYH